MKQSKLLIDTLKRYLKHRGITYGELAGALGQSESNIKRVFSHESFSLKALEAICEAAGIGLLDLARMARPEKENEAACFSRAQEVALADDPKLFTFLYLLFSGHSPKRIVAEFQFTKEECERALLRLDKLGLVRLHAENRFRLLASKNIRWIPNGPLNTLYAREIKKEFMDSDFSKANERLRFLNGSLSKQSMQTLSRRIDRLVAEFVQLAEIDEIEEASETKPIWLIVAHRPWRFSLVARYRRE